MISEAQQSINDLDADLEEDGEYITLRRVIGSGSNTSNVDCQKVPAAVRAFKPEELVGGITQTDSQVIISPTVLRRKQWLPPASPSLPSFPWLPQINNKAIIQGRVRKISFMKPIVVGGEVVRIELVVAG